MEKAEKRFLGKGHSHYCSLDIRERSDINGSSDWSSYRQCLTYTTAAAIFFSTTDGYLVIHLKLFLNAFASTYH